MWKISIKALIKNKKAFLMQWPQKYSRWLPSPSNGDREKSSCSINRNMEPWAKAQLNSSAALVFIPVYINNVKLERATFYVSVIQGSLHFPGGKGLITKRVLAQKEKKLGSLI